MGAHFDPEALAALELVLDVYNSGDPQWAQWATSFCEQHNDRAFTVAEVLQSVINRHGLHSAVSGPSVKSHVTRNSIPRLRSTRCVMVASEGVTRRLLSYHRRIHRLR